MANQSSLLLVTMAMLVIAYGVSAARRLDEAESPTVLPPPVKVDQTVGGTRVKGSSEPPASMCIKNKDGKVEWCGTLGPPMSGHITAPVDPFLGSPMSGCFRNNDAGELEACGDSGPPMTGSLVTPLDAALP